MRALLKRQPLVLFTMMETAPAPYPMESVPVAVPPPEKMAAGPVRLPEPASRVAVMAPVLVPAAALIFRPVMKMDSLLSRSEPAMLTVSTLPAMLAVAPSEPVDPTVLGVPTKVTAPVTGAAGAIVTVNEPAAFVGIEAMASSLNVKLTLLAEVPPTGTLPALPTVMAANADGATAVARREARSAALVAALIAFFIKVK